MEPSDTMSFMPVPPRPQPTNSRVLAGKAARDLIAYAGMTVLEAGDVANNLATPTIKRILRGDPTVSDVKLQAMAGVLKLPINFFLMIIADDRRGLDALTMPEHVREYLVSLLGPHTPPKGGRRAEG